MTQRHLKSRRGIGNSLGLFALSQVLLVGGIAVAAVLSIPSQSERLPQFQNEPRSVELEYNWQMKRLPRLN